MIRERKRQWCSVGAVAKAMRPKPTTGSAQANTSEQAACPDCGAPVVVIATASLVDIRPGKLPEPVVTLDVAGPNEGFLHPCAHPKPQGTGGAGLRSHGRLRERQGLLFDGAAA